MRVLLFTHGFPPRAIGGTEIYAEALARELHRHGDDVCVITREEDRDRPEYEVRREERDGIRIAAINNTYRGTRSLEDTWRGERIAAVAAGLIDEYRPDVAHIHHLTGLSSTIPRLLADRGIPSVYTLHDYWLMCHRGQLLDQHYRVCDGPGESGCAGCLGAAGGVRPVAFRAAPAVRAIASALPAAAAGHLRRAAAAASTLAASEAQAARQARARARDMRAACEAVSLFVAPSRHVRDRFVGFGIDPDRIVVSGNGIDLAMFRPAARARSARLRIGFVGSLMISKGLHVLLEAIDRLPQDSCTVEVYGSHAAYHGDDSYRARLEPLLKKNGVSVHGAADRQAIAAAMPSFDLLVVPSIWPETSSLVIREALAAGVPVVASRIGAVPEIVGDDWLFEPGNPDDLARVLRRLVDGPAEGGPYEREGGPYDREGGPDDRACDRDNRRSARTAPRSIVDDARATRERYAELAMRRPPRRASKIAAVVLNYRTPDDTRLAVKSLLASRAPLHAIIVVDNDEREGARPALQDLLPSITYLHTGRNLGFSGGMNVGIRAALAGGADAVLLANSDVIVPPDCVARLEEALRRTPGAGIAGPIVLERSEPGLVSSRGMSYVASTGRMRQTGYGTSLRSRPLSGNTIVDGVSGCFMLIRREVLEAIGLLDEAFFFSFEDLELCLRAKRAGFETVLAGSAVVYHEGSRSMGPDTRRRLFFAARNHLLLARRAHAGAGAAQRLFRTASIVLLNVAHAMRSGGGSLPVRLGAVARGALDYRRGRFGADSR